MRADDIARSRFYLSRRLLFTAVGVLLFFGLLEASFRGYFFINNREIPRTAAYSKKFGWVTITDAAYNAVIKGYGKVGYSTSSHGFRCFGDVHADRLKLMVLGDSQTDAKAISDGETYYDYIGAACDAELFAYGCGGYGTLQEFMILDEYYEIVKPDLILFQTCENDFTNNSFELESRSWAENCHMTRPYLINGRIEYKFPSVYLLNRSILNYSYVLKFINCRLGILFSSTIDRRTSAAVLGGHSEFFEAAVKTTSEILHLITQKCEGTPLLFFPACGNSDETLRNRRFSELCEQNNIFYIHGIPEAIAKAAADGVKVDGLPYNSHWNSNAHAIAGAVISDYLRNNHFLKNELPRRGPSGVQ